MIPRPHAPRVRRSSIVLAIAVAALAFPLGVLATHQFSDVPTGASYHDDVEALVNAGVTTGCGDGKYCPSNNVTRGQMAQFLNRLGNLDGNSTPSVDADMVDGLHADDLSRAAVGTMTGDVLLTTGYQSLGSVTITAPTAGFVVVDGTTTVYSFDADCGCEIHVGLSTTAVPPGLPDAWNNAIVGSAASATQASVISVSEVFSVSAGTNTFHLSGLNFQASATVEAHATFGTIVAQFTPFGEGVVTSSGGPAGPSTSDPRLTD